MFDKLKERVKGVKYKLFPVATISEAISADIPVSSKMAESISLWSDMLAGRSPWLFDQDTPAEPLELAVSVAGELARLATIESGIEIGGSLRADYLNAELDVVRARLREQLESGIGLGGMVFKPYVDGQRIAVDFSRADRFYPVSFDGVGRLTGIVFVESITRGSKLYRRLEYHHMEGDGCIIENQAFVTSSLAAGFARLGEPIPLQRVKEWESLEPSIKIENVDRLLIGYFKMPLANTVDDSSPLGISGFARAADTIKEAERQWARTLWEYEGSELALHVDPTLINAERDLPRGKKRLYRIIPGLDNDKKMDVFSPAIRDASYFNGLNNILKRIEYQCALAYGTLSDPQNVDKTATEVEASKQRSYATVRDIQKALQTALDDLVYAMDIWTTIGGLAPAGTYRVTYKWDDSIISDPSQRKQLFWQYVVAGKFPMWKYLVEFEDYEEKEAKALVNEASSMPRMFEDGT